MKTLKYTLTAILSMAQPLEPTQSPWIVKEGASVEHQAITPIDNQLSLDVSYKFFTGEGNTFVVDALLVSTTVSGEIQNGANILTYQQFADPISTGKY